MSNGTAPAPASADPIPTIPFTTLSNQDNAVLQHVDRALADARLLKQWWQKKEKARDFSQSFDLVRTFNPANYAVGFFDVGTVSTGALPIMGVVQEMCFDQPKEAPKNAVRDEFREFLLHYFMRISSFHEPEASVETQQPKIPPSLDFLSWFPENLDTRVGFGYSQLYYKLKASGQIGKVPDSSQFAIFDLRELGEKFEWVVLRVQVFNFSLTFRPFGPNGVVFGLPLNEQTYLVLHKDFMNDGENRTAGPERQYGFGYALLKYAPDTGIFAYGPGQFDAGFQLINFGFSSSGELRVQMIFVVNRPRKILKVNIDPISWGLKIADLLSLGLASRLFAPMKQIFDELPLRLTDFDPVTAYISVANGLTGGEAARGLGISLEQLEKTMLVQHYMEHYRMVVGSLLTWRQVPDWLDQSAIPEWANTGLGR